MTDELLKLHTERMFVKKVCDRSLVNVQAALVTAASKMAKVGAVVSEEDVLRTLVEAYGLEASEEGLAMVGMDPALVEAAIGYNVNFEDRDVALAEYEANKAEYDAYYAKVVAKTPKKDTFEEKAL